MVDSRFFGSPTKVFEYMSVAGGVVASDLEQIGEVLRPALSPAMLDDDDLQAGDARAVLCTPGDEDEFVASVLALVERPELCRALGANARKAVLKHHTWDKHVDKVWQFAVQQSLVESAAQIQSNELSLLPESGEPSSREVQILETGDRYKDETQEQWNADACGSHYVTGIQEDTLEWFLEVERYRYEEYGPWMPETMGFAKHAGQDVLEVGAGIGTDLAQFAANGARTTDIDLSAGHLQHARRNFELRGLAGRFVHQDAEIIPFDDASFDLVYSNGVIHHTPNTQHVIDEMWRVLRPGGKLVVMVYAENSYHYWKGLFFDIGIRQGLLATCSMGEIMSRSVELSTEDQRPLVKVYSEKRLRRLFKQFSNVSVVQRQLVRAELPLRLRWLNADKLGCYVGWNLVIKGQKSSRP
jgi:ubiquinone/menaquinone biosynthesis C-methylase UbiE